MYHGWSDPALTPLEIVAYYRSVIAKFGSNLTKVRNFARLFMMPGMHHCGGGPGPNIFDAMVPLVLWVETGTKPDTILLLTSTTTTPPASSTAGCRYAPSPRSRCSRAATSSSPVGRSVKYAKIQFCGQPSDWERLFMISDTERLIERIRWVHEFYGADYLLLAPSQAAFPPSCAPDRWNVSPAT